jgi:hypothetical protein
MELYAFQQYIRSGGTDESLKTLQATSKEVATMYQDIGQKPWAQSIVNTLTTDRAFKGQDMAYTLASGGGPLASFGVTANRWLTQQSSYTAPGRPNNNITIKLDGTTTESLLSGRTVLVTQRAALVGT